MKEKIDRGTERPKRKVMPQRAKRTERKELPGPFFPSLQQPAFTALPGKYPLVLQLIWPQRVFSKLIYVVKGADLLALFSHCFKVYAPSTLNRNSFV